MPALSAYFPRLFRHALLAAVLMTTAAAQEVSVQVDPLQTRVSFELPAVMHTVHGNFRLKNGLLRFDAQTGAASGQLTVDAATGETGNSGRDRKMHQQVLESARYGEITFYPQRVVGKVPSVGTSQMEIDGLVAIHGQSHPVAASGPVQVNGDQVSAELRFVVPYQQWGMKNPSTFLLRVSDKVEITVHAVGRLAPAAASTSTRADTPTH